MCSYYRDLFYPLGHERSGALDNSLKRYINQSVILIWRGWLIQIRRNAITISYYNLELRHEHAILGIFLNINFTKYIMEVFVFFKTNVLR